MKSTSGSLKYFKVTLDNTFDGFSWELTNTKDKEKWKAYLGNLGDSKWYNSMGHSASEKAKLINCKTSVEAMLRIERAISDYLKK